MEGKVSTQVFTTNGTVIVFCVCGWVCVRVGIIYPPFVHKCPLREQLGHAAALCSGQEGISLQSTRCVCSRVWSFSYNGSHVVCSLMQLVAEGTLSTSACRYGLYGRGTAVSRGRGLLLQEHCCFALYAACSEACRNLCWLTNLQRDLPSHCKQLGKVTMILSCKC